MSKVAIVIPVFIIFLFSYFTYSWSEYVNSICESHKTFCEITRISIPRKDIFIGDPINATDDYWLINIINNKMKYVLSKVNKFNSNIKEGEVLFYKNGNNIPTLKCEFEKFKLFIK